MRVLMFGWEFPPFSSGGLGTACYGLTKGLSSQGVEVIFVVPKFTSSSPESANVKLISAGIDKIFFRKVNSALTPYATSFQYERNLNRESPESSVYGKNLFEEVFRYSEIAKKIASEESFDVIHSHDWMSFRAGINAKKISGKPLVVHVHATEFDRTGGHGVNQAIYNLEKDGMHLADSIIAVSNFTKNKIVEHYGIHPDKVQVVHNAVDFNEADDLESYKDKKNNKTVLYLGRVTIQKGPDHFLHAAKKVLEKEPNARFIIAGTGDMEQQTIELAVNLGISNNVMFAGFVDQKKIDRIYRMANLYVMPSVSEPFGITPLESMRNETPVIISKQSGVSEVLNHCLKVDFWDINEMANKIVSVLRYNALHEELRENGKREVRKLNWRKQARKCVDVYNNVKALNA